MEENNFLAKEIITVLDNFDKDFVEKIPKEFIESFKELSEKCEKTVELDMTKKLKEQNISQECKDFIAIMYYYYFANDDEKKSLIKKWKENDNINS